MHLDPLTWSWEFFDEQYRLCRIVVAGRLREQEHADRLTREVLQSEDPGWHAASVSHVERRRDTLTLLAMNEEETAIGTMSLVPDGPCALPSEELFKEEVDSLRLNDRKLCEITRFAIAHPHDSRQLTANMFMLGAVYARRILQTQEFVLVSNSKQRSFHNMLGFKSIRHKRDMAGTWTLMRSGIDVQQFDGVFDDEEHTARTLEYLHQATSECDTENLCVKRESVCTIPQ